MALSDDTLSFCERDLTAAFRAWVADDKLSAPQRFGRPVPIAEVCEVTVARAQGRRAAYQRGLARISKIAGNLVEALDAETDR